MSTPEVGMQQIRWNELDSKIDYLLSPPELHIDYLAKPTNRTLEQVSSEHGFELDEFLSDIEGKSVLDLGCGTSSLQYHAGRLGVKTQIVAVDVPRAFFDKNAIRSGVEAVGLAEALPFRDSSFDLIFSTYALPFYLNSRSQVDGFIGEGIRVLSPGGRFSMAPAQIVGRGNNLETGQVIEAHFLQTLKDVNEQPHLNVSLESNRPNNATFDRAVIEKS
jgi:ubiquinone/menaquinone biosynthesis C-methylase UbiE